MRQRRCTFGRMVIVLSICGFVSEYTRIASLIRWTNIIPYVPPCQTVQLDNGVQYCVNGTKFIVEDRAQNCSKIPLFDPYTVNGTGVHRFKPSLSETNKTCLRVKFSTSHKMPRTALASHPGSGNTWTRHLIQQLTGVYVGAIYNELVAYDKDGKPTAVGFKEGAKWIRNGSCIAIKSHEGGSGKYGKYNPHQYDKAIVIIRDPHSSIMAEYKRIYSSRHGRPKNITKDIFSPKGNFRTFFNTTIQDWFTFYNEWLNEDKCTLVLQYKHLKEDLHVQLLRIAHFLGINVHSLKPSHMDCLLNHTGSSLVRGKVIKPSDPYTENMELQLEHYISKIRNILHHKHGIMNVSF